MRRQTIIVILLAMAAISSCTKDNNPPENIISEFPNEVGNHWRYKYSEYYYGAPVSYIDVDIIGTQILASGQIAKIWVYKILNYTDTNYVVVNGDSVIIYDPDCRACYGPDYTEKMRYIFPLHVGDTWFTTSTAGDTTKVLTDTIIAVPAGTFKNTFHLSKKRNYMLNAFTDNKIWFTPKIGVTRFKQREYALGYILGYGLWELESYSLK